MSDIKKLIQFIRKEFNRSLKLFALPNKPEYLYDPIKYALKGEGKRCRPILVHLSGKAYKTDPDIIMKVSLAVEMLHCFTLIHDDIMDSDNIRRNMPTLHHQYDISSAILAGDGMFTISQLVLNGIKKKSTSLMQFYNEAVLEICEGQALDKEFEDQAEKKNNLIKDKSHFKRKSKLAKYLINRGFENNLVWELDECKICGGPGKVKRCYDNDGDGLGSRFMNDSVCPDSGKDWVEDCTDLDEYIYCESNEMDCAGTLCGALVLDECEICGGNGPLESVSYTHLTLPTTPYV